MQSGSALSDGQVLSDRTGSVFYLKDHLGTVTDLIDGSGEIIQKYDYTAFGVLRSVRNEADVEIGIASAPIRTSYAYTGREYETETGLYYYRASSISNSRIGLSSGTRSVM